MIAGEQGRSAAQVRGEAARRRIDELQQRRAELAAGIPSSAETVRLALRHAHDSLERVRRAYLDAAARHLDAGAAHRRAAASHEQAALFARDPTDESHQDAAAMHRAEAAIHEAAAIVDGEHAAQVWASINNTAPALPPSRP